MRRSAVDTNTRGRSVSGGILADAHEMSYSPVPVLVTVTLLVVRVEFTDATWSIVGVVACPVTSTCSTGTTAAQRWIVMVACMKSVADMRSLSVGGCVG